MKVIAKADSTEIQVYEAIGRDPWFGDGVSAKEFRAAVKAVKTSKIDLRINSGGGSVFEAVAMMAALDEFKGEITGYVDGWAASAASVILMTADVIKMANGSQIMIHDPYTAVGGGSAEMRRIADLLDSIRDDIVKTYKRHSNLSASEISDLMAAETWMDTETAIKNGFAHEVNSGYKVAAFHDASKFGYKNTPKQSKDAAIEATKERFEWLDSVIGATKS